MALSIENVSPHNPLEYFGRLKARVVTVTFDDEYPTGGESLTAADLGLADIYAVFVSPDASTAPGFVVAYDYAASTLMVFDEGAAADAPLTELADTSSDVDGLEVRVLVVGA